MKLSSSLKVCGVYRIHCLASGKSYVGSSDDIYHRLHGHRGALRRGSHPNTKLQRAFDKYGESEFVCSLLEKSNDNGTLFEREQYWIDTLEACINGYNVVPAAGSVLGLKWTEEQCDNASKIRRSPLHGFITPEGYPVTILNIHGLCRQLGLSNKMFYSLSCGIAVSYRGWTHENAKKPVRKWINSYEGFIDPDGNPVPAIVNLEKFCRERGLIASNMNKVYRGVKQSHKGWTCSKPAATTSIA